MPESRTRRTVSAPKRASAPPAPALHHAAPRLGVPRIDACKSVTVAPRISSSADNDRTAPSASQASIALRRGGGTSGAACRRRTCARPGPAGRPGGSRAGTSDTAGTPTMLAGMAQLPFFDDGRVVSGRRSDLPAGGTCFRRAAAGFNDAPRRSARSMTTMRMCRCAGRVVAARTFA